MSCQSRPPGRGRRSRQRPLGALQWSLAAAVSLCGHLSWAWALPGHASRASQRQASAFKPLPHTLAVSRAPGIQLRARGSALTQLWARGRGDDAQEEKAADPILEPGLFIAATNIRLRTEPDVGSSPTGAAVKTGEVFEVTEVLVPPDWEATGELAYLRVGDRGWVFDRGISGEWAGKSIVDNVPEEDVEVFGRILADPVAYADYRKIMDDPDHLAKIASMFEEKPWRKEMRDIDKEEAQKAVELGKRVEALVEDPEALEAAEKEASEKAAEQDSEGKAEDSRVDGDWILDGMRQKLSKANPLPEEPTTMVAPRWMKLAGKGWADVERDEEGRLRRPVIKELPGGELAMRVRPTCSGWRMGIRIPSVASTL